MIFFWKDWKSVYFVEVEIRKRVLIDRNSLLNSALLFASTSGFRRD